MVVRDLLLFYSECGMTYAVISEILHLHHNILLSANAICKRLKRYGLQCRRGPVSITQQELQSIVLDKLKLLPKTVGYRQLTDLLKQEGHHVRRYDKLKPYGFPIHGCIDGKIMWLNVCPSNNDPKLVAHFYMSRVKKLQGCPLIVQADKGTENTIIGALQCIFREDDDREISGRRGFQYISSQLNQRIESWWSSFRRRSSQWWIELFKDLVQSGQYEVSSQKALSEFTYVRIHLEVASWCIELHVNFDPCIIPQRDLDAVAEQWNNHHMSMSRHVNCPNGRPNVLYCVPSISGSTDCLQDVGNDAIEFGFSHTIEPTISGDEEFDRSADEYCSKIGLTLPETWQQALQLYYFLLDM
ncbi:hypothetical protein KUTeg_021470 [Tegillarca granosa]|uniref:Integrase core domain-containing protein n=1 Tax=Tegillarca granosa TaxID=220873 RepID=A0ABQ9E845_TEGGR|nr:hypothetical protein KUTeg_021470 [Tegillarca granosa]